MSLTVGAAVSGAVGAFRRPGHHAVPLRLGPVSWRLPVRAAAVTVAGVVVLFVLFALDLALGEVRLPFLDVVSVLLGGGDPGARFIVAELRLPQGVVALLAGSALGLAGCLTQTFARNPLASPDILGVTQGAAAGAVGAIVLAGGSGYGAGAVSGLLQQLGLPAAAFLGGLAAAAVLAVLSWRGGIAGQRLVLIGIGLGAALTAVTQWLLVSARIQDAASAQVWLNGSLNGRGWDQAIPLVIALGVLAPVSLLLVRTLNALQLGDDSALGLGVHLQRAQLLLLLVAVGLSATAVSAVGPLVFVALVVPQVALRLTGGSRPPVLASMVAGAVLVVASDLVTRVVLPWPLPAGIVTAVLGAPYLIWLLVRARRVNS